MGVKIAQRPRDIANARPIHQAQYGAVELGQKAGTGEVACLAGAFS